jgi:hypothetical protein
MGPDDLTLLEDEYEEDRFVWENDMRGEKDTYDGRGFEKIVSDGRYHHIYNDDVADGSRY